MKFSKLRISTSDLDRTINYFIGYLDFDYENHSKDMSILSSEEYYIRNNSTQMNMIIAKQEGDSILIDIIGGAGGSGLLNISLWSESGYLKRVKKVINRYVKEFDLVLEEL